MPTVHVTATVKVPEGTTLAALEDQVARIANQVGRELIAQAMPVLGKTAMASPLRAHRTSGWGSTVGILQR